MISIAMLKPANPGRGYPTSSGRMMRGLRAARRLSSAGAALMRTWRMRRSNRDYLRTASDLDLRDMGLKRADAQREAAKPFWTA